MKKSRILKQSGAGALAGALMIGVVRAQTGSGAEGVPGLAGLLRDSLYEEEANRDLTTAAADPGMWIAEAEHGRIFELFHRLGNELRRETTGTGIELAIVKHVAEGHGGVVMVVSAPGRGSRFRLEFPGPAGAGDGVVSSQEEVDKGGEAGDGREAS